MSRSVTRIGERPLLKWTLVGAAAAVAVLLLVVPLLLIFSQAFAQGVEGYWRHLSNAYTLHAIGLTLLVAGLTVPINLLFGTAIAWLLTRFEFFGRKALLTVLDLPIAVSPIIAGLVYLLLYGRNGWLGSLLLETADLRLMFAWPGIVMVTVFVTSPYVARELIPLMQQQGRHDEEAALSLGASGWRMFSSVTLPNIRWALLYGVILTNARAVGEFGAVSVVSGRIRGRTNTLPLHIELLFQDHIATGAFVAASLLTVIALLTLVVKGGLSWYLARPRLGASQDRAQ